MLSRNLVNCKLRKHLICRGVHIFIKINGDLNSKASLTDSYNSHCLNWLTIDVPHIVNFCLDWEFSEEKRLAIQKNDR